MSLVTSGVALRHRTRIERDQNLGEDTDAGGNPIEPDWQEHLSDLPCRAWADVAKEIIDGRQTAVIEDRRIAVRLGVDILESDRVGAVTEADGSDLFDGPMKIEGRLAYPDHIELLLERIR